MRPRRFRLTIGRTMALMLLVGVASWYVLVHRPGLRKPTTAERIAEANYKQARLVREVAELAVVEFERGSDRENAALLAGEAALTRADIDRAVDRLKWSDTMRSKGYVSEATRVADGLTLDRAGFDADQVCDRLETLEKSAGPKPIKALNAVLEKARADEQSRLENYRLERDKRLSWWRF
jgi:HlyD family secretion protein